MIAEILLILAGHSSSVFNFEDNTIQPEFATLLHPGEQQCLQALGLIASRCRAIRLACSRLARAPSRYICAFCSKVNEILNEEYDALIVQTEAKVLKSDVDYVGRGSLVPLSAIRATFAIWESPLAVLESLMGLLEKEGPWSAGNFIDLILSRSDSGVDRVASVMSRLAECVQKVWVSQLQAFLTHGSLAADEPIASTDYVLHDDAFPSCVSNYARQSIVYVGRAIGTIKALKWHVQIPSSIALNHARMLDKVLPQEQQAFEATISQIRSDISEWIWTNVLTMNDIEDAMDSLASYFLLQNGEFALAFVREVEKLKQTRLTARSGPSTLIREQDLHFALLRASLGTSAQHDARLSRIQFQLPMGPFRPLLQGYGELPAYRESSTEQVRFDDILLGTPLKMTYGISWPLDLFLQASDLTIYTNLFSFLSSLRHVHMRVHMCWTSLSNAQRARRRWTGLDEGGTEDSVARKELLRCGWGTVRLMSWFLDVLLGYIMNDVIEAEFRKLKTELKSRAASGRGKSMGTARMSNAAKYEAYSGTFLRNPIGRASSQRLDFTTLRLLHSIYLEHLQAASLLTQPALIGTIREILGVCEQLMGLIERWDGDVLPALLVEGSVAGGKNDSVGLLVKERREILQEVDQTIKELLGTFYDQLSAATSQPLSTGDASKSILVNTTSAHQSTLLQSVKVLGLERDGETRRHWERLLLRLDFNRMFSRPRMKEAFGPSDGIEILKEGGLV